MSQKTASDHKWDSLDSSEPEKAWESRKTRDSGKEEGRGSFTRILWLRIFASFLVIGETPVAIGLMTADSQASAMILAATGLLVLILAKIAADAAMWPVEQLRNKLAWKNFGSPASGPSGGLLSGNVFEILEFAAGARPANPDSIRLPVELEKIEHLARAGKASELAMESVKKDLFRHMSHQLKSPLAILRAHAEELESEVARLGLDNLRAGARKVSELSLDVSSLVDGILSLAWVESLIEKGVLDQSANLSKGLMSVVMSRQGAAQAKTISMESTVPAGLWVRGEESLLKELFACLIDNAIRYSPPGGRIFVEAGEIMGSGAIYARITDEGPGIPKEQRQRVFEPFYGFTGKGSSGEVQFGSRRHESVDGRSLGVSHGLGLALVRSVARLHRTEVVLTEGRGGVGLCAQIILSKAPMNFDD